MERGHIKESASGRKSLYVVGVPLSSRFSRDYAPHMQTLALLLVAALAGGPRTEPPQDSLMSPGVSEALARYRRDRIRDVRYDLAFDLTARDTASGRAIVRFVRRGDDDVILDFRGTALSSIRANGDEVPNVEFNGAHIRIPRSYLRRGENRIEVAFSALIAAAGASIIRVDDRTDATTYLYTLLVPADANQLFPSFDQPDLKARVSLALTTPLEWSAVANGAALRVDSTSRGAVHLFRESEPISTYLVAFAAGPWATVQSTVGNRPITLYVRRSRLAEVDADSIIAENARAATWLEGYFGSPFPFHKLDLVLAPAFPFGGMEHPGAVFYSEERFVFRERPTPQQLLGRTATIYHEIAHQWFGDLVTMKWFDDLWLKEGFATYMAAKMQDALDPKSDAWKSFYLRNKPLAYAVDGSEGTTPVWQRLDNLDQAKSNYGAIVYNKAPSILKQLNYLVGDSAFRSGVQRFLTRHAYENATWQDLLSAIGSASGRPLDAWGEAYVLRPGMPIIEQRLEVRNGRIQSLTLRQRPARALSGDRPWPIRLEVLIAPVLGDMVRIPVLLNADSVVVTEAVGRPAPRFVFANASDYAYGIVQLDPRSVTALETDIASVKDPFLRAQLWGAIWDQVREALVSPERFIRLAVRELPSETDEQIVGAVVARMARAVTAYATPLMRSAMLPDVERMLLRGLNNEARTYGVRKAYLDAWVALVGTPPGVSELDGMLDSVTVVGAPLGAPTRWAMVTRLVELGAAEGQRRLADESRRDPTPEGLRRAFVARAATPDPLVKARYFKDYFGADLNEDWVTSSLDAFNATSADSLTMPYLRSALDSLQWIQQNRRIFFITSWIGSFVGGHSTPEALELIRAFLRERTDLPADLRAKVLQATDELERTVRIRRAFGINPI